MIKLRGLLSNLTFFFCCLLAFLLVFENSFVSPPWLQVAGRMHPLLLHFPIVLLIVYALLKIIDPSPKIRVENVVETNDLLLVGCFTASLSAIMGLLLSKEGGYSTDSLFWHKWLGSVSAFIGYGWYVLRKNINGHAVFSRVLAIATILVITFAGHKGAGITHGENFVLAPVTPKKMPEQVPLEEAVVFDHLIRPILEEKCMACHNSRKAKGELVMETAESLLAGGKNGLLWDTLNTEESLILKRIHLPEEEEEHMPPSGKPQLTDQELTILETWIGAGAPLQMRISDFSPEHELYQLAAARFSQPESESYEFEAADPEVVEVLNSFYRQVSPVSLNSPALAVRFLSAEAFASDQLSELSKISKQIVELNLGKMPVTDADVEIIGQFDNLEKLNLNFSQITDEGLKQIAKLKKLKELSLSGTSITEAGLSKLAENEKLTKVFIWNTVAAATEVEVLQASLGEVTFETGYDAANTIIPLPAPVIENSEAIFTEPLHLKLKHYINGAVLRYTLDGSEPDSVNSSIYEDGILLDTNASLKVRAFKEGWYGSELVTKTFLRSALTPEKAVLLSPPDEKYKADQEKSLFDREKGSTNHGDGYWLGYEGRKMEVILTFREAPSAKSITISYLASTGSYIMPPASVEIWYGSDVEELRLHKKHIIPQPSDHLPVAPQFLSFLLPEEKYEQLKVIITPVMKLPAWHDGKGNPGWVFVDELLFN